VFWPRLSLSYGGTIGCDYTATTNELKNCYGCVKEVGLPRIRLLTDYYITVMLRICYGYTTVLPEVTRSSHGYTTVLTGHNRSISVVYPVRSVVNRDQFQTTDQIGICYGYAAVASRRLRLSTVSYEHVENRATEKTKRHKRDG